MFSIWSSQHCDFFTNYIISEFYNEVVNFSGNWCYLFSKIMDQIELIRHLIEIEVVIENNLFFLQGIIHKMKVIDESIFHRLRERFRFGCRSYKGERIDRKSNTSAFRHYHIDNKIFHSDIQNFFNSGLETVNFINKKNISFFKWVKDADEFTGFGKCVSRNDFEWAIHLFSDDSRKCCFTKTAGSRKENMS